MRAISKSAEPPSLSQYRATPGSNYDDYDDKQTLREFLVREQRGLCCYCLCRINAGKLGMLPTMKIAHWHSQNVHPEEQLVYSNLLGACKGNEGQPPSDQHCDTRQGNRDIKWNPANPLHPILEMTFVVNGRIKSRDPEFDRQINEVLNLNVAFLVNNRKVVLDSFTKALPRQGTWPRPVLERLRREWNGESHSGELEEYCQVVVYWLQKRLRRG